MKRLLLALGCGTLFLCIVVLLGREGMASRVAALLLTPGWLAGMSVPGAGYDPEGTLHPPSLLAAIVIYGVNVLLYSGIAWTVLSILHRRTARQKPEPAR